MHDRSLLLPLAASPPPAPWQGTRSAARLSRPQANVVDYERGPTWFVGVNRASRMTGPQDLGCCNSSSRTRTPGRPSPRGPRARDPGRQLLP
jgi:hypothetical protein